jgi:hypothetical protein
MSGRAGDLGSSVAPGRSSDEEVVVMTPHFTNEDFAALGGPDLVYVREVKAKEVLGGTPVDAIQGFELDPDQTLYALHSANGARLAVLIDKPSAVAAAVAHELVPVSVH